MRSITKALIAVATPAALIGGMFATAGSASAEVDHRPCVSQVEYNAVHRGMSQAQVAALFDNAGTQLTRRTSGGYWTGAWIDDGYWSYGYWVDTSYWESHYRWHSGHVDTVRAYNKCPGWGIDRVGVNFDNYTDYRTGMRAYTKRGGDAWGLVDYVTWDK